MHKLQSLLYDSCGMVSPFTHPARLGSSPSLYRDQGIKLMQENRKLWVETDLAHAQCFEADLLFWWEI